MSRGNRRKPGARHDTWPSSRFSPASDPGPEVALPLTDVFSDLELEFFRQGDDLDRERPVVNEPAGDPVWALEAAE